MRTKIALLGYALAAAFLALVYGAWLDLDDQQNGLSDPYHRRTGA